MLATFCSVPDRFLIDAYGPDDDAVRRGVQWLVEYAREHGASNATVLVPGISNAENLARALGDLGTRLYKNRQARVDGITIALATTLTLRGYNVGPLLAVWANDDMVSKAERVTPPAICAIPWSDTDLSVWKAAWAPADLRAGEPAGPPPVITNPVVRVAMEHLTNRVNLSAALSHPSDKSAAVLTLKTLVKGRKQFEPAEIEAWAVANGWRQSDAKRLGEMAQAILDDRRVYGGTACGIEVLERWREEAERGPTPRS